MDSPLHMVRQEARVAEVLLEFTDPVLSEDGKSYIARACGDEMPGGMWQAWIEFVPAGSGAPVRSGRETTQPNRLDTVYWATGLTPVFLEGSLKRALKPLVRPIAHEPAPAIFDSPAPPAWTTGGTESALNPFSVYRKGELLLRRQLSALASWHLINIIRAYHLSDENEAWLEARTSNELVELIVRGVRADSNIAR
jgi:hypothetical protein